MPTGNYPQTHKHVKARGLSKNKYDAKGELRPPRKSRSKLADTKKELGIKKDRTPEEELAVRRGRIQYGLDNYDFSTNILLKQHLEYLQRDDTVLLTEEGRLTADTFAGDHTMYGIFHSVGHGMTKGPAPKPIQPLARVPLVIPKVKPIVTSFDGNDDGIVLTDDNMEYFKEVGYGMKGKKVDEDAEPGYIYHRNMGSKTHNKSFPTYNPDNPYELQQGEYPVTKNFADLLTEKGQGRHRAKRSDAGVLKAKHLTEGMKPSVLPTQDYFMNDMTDPKRGGVVKKHKRLMFKTLDGKYYSRDDYNLMRHKENSV